MRRKGFRSAIPLGTGLLTDRLRLNNIGAIDIKRATVREALNRGANEVELLNLRLQRSYGQPLHYDGREVPKYRNAFRQSPHGLLPLSADLELQLLIFPEVEAYRK